MSTFRPESHVAQQSRRDKLRIHEGSSQLFQHSGDLHTVISPDLVQVRKVRNANASLLYEPTLISSSALRFSPSSNILSAQSDENKMLGQQVETAQHGRLPLAEDSMSPSILTHFNASRVATVDRQGYGNWKSMDSQQACDWMVSHASGSSGGMAVLSNNARESNISATTRFLKAAYDGNQDVQSALVNPCSEICGQDSSRRYGDLHFPSTQLHSSTVFEDIVTTASVGTRTPDGLSLPKQNIRQAVRSSWATDYSGNHSGSFHLGNADVWLERPPDDNCHQWKGEKEPRGVASDATAQGLALSLSSAPQSKVRVAQLGEEYGSNGLLSRSVESKDPQDYKILKRLLSMDNPSIISKASGKSLQDIVGASTYIPRHVGPLGPFTGYVTILKNSRFLKPAQELLEDFCKMTNSKLHKICNVSDGISVKVVSASASTDATHRAADMEAPVKGNNSGASSLTFYSSNENGLDGGLRSSASEQPYRAACQHKKAKLLYLREEVCKRYKLYYQQMQMVVSSFESVAGLSGATPYISLALKTVARNFRSLKNTVSDQIRHISRALGEDLFPPTAGTKSSKGDMNKLKYMGHKSGGVNVGFLEPQQHGWRPQRGLPERSVAILRAWLFEHFLHPYPTDTDKHMLATQTGLTRNQVSNWFINARVRVWKPMVEEVHMLESKGLAKANQINSGKTDIRSASEGISRQNSDDHAIIGPSINNLSNGQLGSSISDVHHMVDTCADQWKQEKRSKDDINVPTISDGTLIGFVPYQRSQLEMGGLGAVSLTLGLRQGLDGARQQHQQEQFHQQDDQQRQQFGGQMIHYFVG